MILFRLRKGFSRRVLLKRGFANFKYQPKKKPGQYKVNEMENDFGLSRTEMLSVVVVSQHRLNIGYATVVSKLPNLSLTIRENRVAHRPLNSAPKLG